MRLVTYGPPNGEEPGVLIDDHLLLPLRPVLGRAGLHIAEMGDLLGLWPAVEALVRQAVVAGDGAVPLDGLRLGPPVPRPGKIVAMGFNYPQHATGVLSGAEPAGDPVVFLKPPSALSGPNDPLVKPPETTQLDYELELGVVIGRACRRIRRQDAQAHVAGYMIANDVTARDIALGAGASNPLLLQIARGKGFPTFCPTGPWLLTSDEIDPDRPLRLTLSVNGERRQDAWTSSMLVDVPGLIASVSATMDLFPGDLILTGSPAGCGFQLDPPGYLHDGDRIQAAITGLGHMDLVVCDEVPDPLTVR
ncbi:fumarylacetoacetate hydrolase family protein [Streptomyces sp. NPDC056697]|uniref:fumarylacetoacetate hydrolase family protein n=1 Tax=Streptomyces sp. NPDC056697 TaxID=3345915 RepID=UPI0036C39886